MEWKCYLLFSLDSNKTYIGSSNDCQRRLGQHNNTKAGAKYTRGETWSTTLVVSGFPDKRACLSFEAGWKRLSKKRSNNRFSSYNLLSDKLGHSILKYTDCSLHNRIMDLIYFVYNTTFHNPKFILDKDLKKEVINCQLCINSFLIPLDEYRWPWFIELDNL
jgi:predicted GIY-YIG superfamily endonuclease